MAQEERGHDIGQGLVVEEMDMHVPQSGNQEQPGRVEGLDRGRRRFIHSRDRHNPIAIHHHPLVVSSLAHAIDDGDVLDSKADRWGRRRAAQADEQRQDRGHNPRSSHREPSRCLPCTISHAFSYL